MSGNANSGRRKSPPLDLTTLEEMSIAQALIYMRLKGRRKSRRKLEQEIAVGRLKAYLNWGRLGCTGQPTYVLKRVDVDRWLRDSLQPLKVASLVCRVG